MLDILKNHSILYVEDEPHIQANIADYLRDFFGDVWVADDGREALMLYTQETPDVVLLDIEIPEIDGLTVARTIRDQDRHVKIVMLTGHTEQERLLEATELKLTKYLVKPIAPKAFKSMLKLLAEELLDNPIRFARLSQGYVWDRIEERLCFHGETVPLSTKSRALLKLLMDHRGQIVTYTDIMVVLWEDAWDRDISIGSVKNQVSLLRKHLPKNSIESLYGQGYKLR